MNNLKSWILGAVIVMAAQAGIAQTSYVMTCRGGGDMQASDDTVMEDTNIDGVVIIPNQGGNSGGHTPINFQGQGTGIFVGDNLNPNFPNGDGVQAFLTFDVSDLDEIDIDAAKLVSSNLRTNGSPFEDLGEILVSLTSFDNFSSALWDLEEQGKVCILKRTSETEVSCDISGALKAVVASGSEKFQIRLGFENISDSDGQQDLALFYRTDSNLNERGLFNIEISSNSSTVEVPRIQADVVLHLLKESGLSSTNRDEDNVRSLFQQSQKIWSQSNIRFDVEVVETTVDADMESSILKGDFQALHRVKPSDNKIHIFYTRSLGGINGIALGGGLAMVADITTVNDYRATAHEIGHLFGLEHTAESRNRLMFQGVNGEVLTKEEIKIARKNVFE